MNETGIRFDRQIGDHSNSLISQLKHFEIKKIVAVALAAIATAIIFTAFFGLATAIPASTFSRVSK